MKKNKYILCLKYEYRYNTFIETILLYIYLHLLHFL